MFFSTNPLSKESQQLDDDEPVALQVLRGSASKLPRSLRSHQAMVSDAKYFRQNAPLIWPNVFASV